MFIRTIRSLLELHPAGLSSEQLLWRLRHAGIRFSADDILQSLGVLIDSGEVAMAEPGRWRMVTFRRATSGPRLAPPAGRATQFPPPEKRLLLAVTATIARLLSQGLSPSPSDTPDGMRADADWKALLRYYAATQRQDPRGRVDERADQHAVSWQLFRAEGNWWSPGELHVLLDALASTFREALMRRPGSGLQRRLPSCPLPPIGGTGLCTSVAVAGSLPPHGIPSDC